VTAGQANSGVQFSLKSRRPPSSRLRVSGQQQHHWGSNPATALPETRPKQPTTRPTAQHSTAPYRSSSTTHTALHRSSSTTHQPSPSPPHSTRQHRTVQLFFDTPHRTAPLFLDGPHPRLPLHRPPDTQPGRYTPDFPSSHTTRTPSPQPPRNPQQSPPTWTPSHPNNTPCLPTITASIDPSVSTRTPAPGQTRPAVAAERGRRPRPRTLVATVAKRT